MSAATNGAQDTEVFDLDVLERDAVPAPFSFRLGGETFAMADPGDMDWQAERIMQTGDPIQILELCLGSDWERFQSKQVPAWKIAEVFKAWARHFGITIPESSASPPSSVNMGRPSRPISATTTASGSPTSPPAD